MGRPNAVVNWRRVASIALAFWLIYSGPVNKCDNPVSLKVSVTDKVTLTATIASHSDNYILAIVWFQPDKPENTGGKEWQIWKESETSYTLTDQIPPGKTMAVATLVRMRYGQLTDFTSEVRFEVK